MNKKEKTGIKIIAKNKKAFFQYHIDEKFEAGVVLRGSEVKSLRDGKGSLADAYAIIKSGEIYLIHAHIAQYAPATYLNHEPRRERKLLLHAKEIGKLEGRLKQSGLTLIPTMLYFKRGKVKVELALASGKKQFDKRDAIKKRETNIDIRRAFKK
ncbi:MAG: SsrA-binding protein SmpB [Deltaproteobacteria bacterium]|jgi:SsrA-binding protein|nr:SsrA-binding protein SmpB [Deltaproteobacteria bacterium]